MRADSRTSTQVGMRRIAAYCLTGCSLGAAGGFLIAALYAALKGVASGCDVDNTNLSRCIEDDALCTIGDNSDSFGGGAVSDRVGESCYVNCLSQSALTAVQRCLNQTLVGMPAVASTNNGVVVGMFVGCVVMLAVAAYSCRYALVQVDASEQEEPMLPTYATPA